MVAAERPAKGAADCARAEATISPIVLGLSSFAVEVDITGLAVVTDEEGWTTFKDNLVSTVLLALLDADVVTVLCVVTLDD